MKKTSQPNARYGVDVRGVSTHAEAESLIEILALLKSQAGHVQVIDRDTNYRTFEGSVEEVRKAIRQELAASGVVSMARHGVGSGNGYASTEGNRGNGSQSPSRYSPDQRFS